MPLHARLVAAQAAAVRTLAAQYGRLGPPPADLDPLGAWQSLQGAASGCSFEGPGVARAVFRKGALSLPQGAAGAVDISQLLPPPLRSLLEDEAGFLRSRADAEGELRRAAVRPALDPRLAKREGDLGDLYNLLGDAGVRELACHRGGGGDLRAPKTAGASG